MTDAQIADVEEEVVAPVAEVNTSEHQETQDVSVETNSDSKENDKEYNFRQMREQMRVIESEKERLARENEEFKKALMGSLKQREQKDEPDVDDLADISDDDWTTRKHVDKIAERRARVIVEEALKKDREERQKRELPDLLKREFADFDEVVTKENVDYLRIHKPHIAATLGATKDPYAQAAAAYEYIKAYCPKVDMAEKKKAEKNAQTQGTLGNAQATSPLSQAKMFETGKLTPELKKKLQQEMIAATKAY